MSDGEAAFWLSQEGQRLRSVILGGDATDVDLFDHAMHELNACIHSLAPHAAVSDEMHASACAERARASIMQIRKKLGR